MEHKMSCKGADYDWQQKGYKEELVHAFLTTRLIGLRFGGISLTWSIKAKSKFPGKRYVEKEIKGYTEVTKKKMFVCKPICYHKHY